MPNYPSPLTPQPSPFTPLVQLSPQHHGVQLVEGAVRAPVAPSPVQPATEMMNLALLDFDPDVACESVTSFCVGRDHPADWYIASHCAGPLPVCDGEVVRQRRLCEDFQMFRCVRCGTVRPNGPYRILGPVRSGGAS